MKRNSMDRVFRFTLILMAVVHARGQDETQFFRFVSPSTTVITALSPGTVGGHPYTSPVGSFAPNGYGVYDMAGNVWTWGWDW
jgi:formylglycine-generating enzyme required for sulfatase activity